MHALFGGLCLARPHTHTLSLSPDYALLERLFERASPAHAPLEHPGSSARMSARPPLTHCSNACSSVRSPAPPPAPRSIRSTLCGQSRVAASPRSYVPGAQRTRSLTRVNDERVREQPSTLSNAGLQVQVCSPGRVARGRPLLKALIASGRSQTS